MSQTVNKEVFLVSTCMRLDTSLKKNWI